MDANVIVVGAGPVGLALAINLGRAGIKTILLERNPEPQFLPKMERCNARSMEMFRRIGLSKKIRDAGLRADCPMDVFVVEDLTKPALLEEKHPSIQTFQGKIKECKDLSMPLEPYQLISQYTLEPLLKAEAEALQSVEVLFGHEFMEFSQSDDGVSVRFKDSDGQSKTLTASYLVGCDGGSSPIRKQLGIKLRGEGGFSSSNKLSSIVKNYSSACLTEADLDKEGTITGQMQNTRSSSCKTQQNTGVFTRPFQTQRQ